MLSYGKYGKVVFLLYDDIKVNDVDHAVLDYMSMQAYNDTEDCNKMLAFAIVAYFTKQTNKEVK